ncbi:unnamed protein product [Mycena citricolor]|uniref:Uncharacterized protein n=1 Tax=Mycena citricolor TaxID=2018698 RepID=A0AAD2Q2B8_9AGAR|nr:unnamed protein product [Mycena citricolor]
MPAVTHALQDLPFDTENVLQAVIRNRGDHSRRYGIRTYYSDDYSTRTETTIENRVGTICGVIDWEKKSFRIGNKVEWVDTMKRKAGMLSAVRYWKWLKGEEFRIQYMNSGDSWTASNDRGEIVAELKLSAVSFGAGETSVPVLRMSLTLRNEDDRLFLLLVLLYSEAKRRVQCCITV